MKLSPCVEVGEVGDGVGVEGRRLLSSMSRARHKVSLLLLKEKRVQGGVPRDCCRQLDKSCRRRLWKEERRVGPEAIVGVVRVSKHPTKVV